MTESPDDDGYDADDNDEITAADQAETSAEFHDWLAGLPLPSPATIVGHLRELGYVGQDRAVRAMALAAHRHVRRIKAIHVDAVPRAELPDKQNMLLVGPTGCGKTYLATLLFREVLQIPTTTVDITSYSESGYIGEDVNTLITRLLYAAEGDVERAMVGMICLDEFDKLASSQNRAVFAGQGTTKDVSGFGVQRELLKLLESSTVAVPTSFSHDTYQSRPLLATDDIAFVACGAFSGLKAICVENRATGIGFSCPDSRRFDQIAVEYDQRELDNVVNFQEFGFLPELIARFTRIVPFAPLSIATLAEILERNVVVSFRRELALASIDLVIEPAVIEAIVEQAIEKQTGARGLRGAMTYHLEDAVFEAYSTDSINRVTLRVSGNQVVAEV